MKLAIAIAIAIAIVAQTAEAASQGWHVKVHVHTVKQQLFETCFSAQGELLCADGLQCVHMNDYYGSCMKTQPTLYDQCGGHSTKGPWKNPCVGANNATGAAVPTCVFVSPYYSQCQNVNQREHYRFKGHEKSNKHHKNHPVVLSDNTKSVPIYSQCMWVDSAVRCDSGLQCITTSEHYGQCRSMNAKLYEQCGGKAWKQPWSATCAQGTCVKRDDWYSQCLPSGTSATASPSPSPSMVSENRDAGVTTGPTAAKWGQCGGAGFSGPTACAADATCVKHNNWYSQCKPLKLPVGELCGQDKDANKWLLASCEGTATCKPSNADKTESRCQA